MVEKMHMVVSMIEKIIEKLMTKKLWHGYDTQTAYSKPGS